MKRNDYKRPTMQVVELQHTGLLMDSGVGASRTNYGDANTGVSNGEKNAQGEWEWN